MSTGEICALAMLFFFIGCAIGGMASALMFRR